MNAHPPICVGACGEPCQFSNLALPLQQIEERSYCPLHAPLNAPEKGLQHMMGILQAVVNAQAGAGLELRGVIFPTNGQIHLQHGSGSVVLRACEFDDRAVLSFASLDANICLENSIFRGSVAINPRVARKFHCSNTRFPAALTINTPEPYPYDLDFSRSIVGGDFKIRLPSQGNFNFRQMQFLGRLDIELANAKKVAQSTSFNDSRFGRRVCTTESEPSFRALRQAFEETGNRDDEGIFYALEKRSQRKSLAYGLTRCVSALYDWTSWYGSNYTRPLVALLSVQILASTGYALASPNYSLAFSFSPELCAFTLAQVLKPFEILGGRIQSTFVEEVVGGVPTGAWALGSSLHAVCSLSLVALSILAIRWRFKRS